MDTTVTTAGRNAIRCPDAPAGRLNLARARRVATRVFDRLFAWQRRLIDRAALQSLDDRMLRDIGLSRADVEFESHKPFWRL